MPHNFPQLCNPAPVTPRLPLSPFPFLQRTVLLAHTVDSNISHELQFQSSISRQYFGRRPNPSLPSPRQPFHTSQIYKKLASWLNNVCCALVVLVEDACVDAVPCEAAKQEAMNYFVVSLLHCSSFLIRFTHRIYYHSLLRSRPSLLALTYSPFFILPKRKEKNERTNG